MTERWTAAQGLAITLRGQDLLVSAGAGAGKTAVLVERVLQRTTDPAAPADLDRLLVVTFSEAAAAEVRGRIARRIEEALAGDPGNQRLRRQLGLLGRAEISTLHSFCLQTLRRYFFRLEIDPASRVLGEQEAKLLQQEVLSDLFEARYAAEDGGFLDLVERYGGPDDGALRSLVLQLHREAFSRPWPGPWLDELAARFDLPPDTPVLRTPWGPPLIAAARRRLERARADLDTALGLCRAGGGSEEAADVLRADRERLDALLAGGPSAASGARAADAGDGAAPGRGEWPAGSGNGRLDGDGAAGAPGAPAGSIEDWNAFRETLLAADVWAALRAGDGVDPELHHRVRDLREDAKATLRGLLSACRPADDLLDELRGFAPVARALVALVRGFDAAFGAAKTQAGQLDFNDMERLALRLLLSPEAAPGSLRPSAVALDARRRFDEVLVDEYQDTSPLQDAILRLVSGDGRRFLVGDARQSIYRFRQAEPALFIDLYRRSRPAGQPRRAHATDTSREGSPHGQGPATAADAAPAPDRAAGDAAGCGGACGRRPDGDATDGGDAKADGHATDGGDATDGHTTNVGDGAAGGQARPAAAVPVRIDLSENFRSRPAVLSAVNFVFRQAMTPLVGGLAYDPEAELTAGAPYPAPGPGAPVELHLVDRGGLVDGESTVTDATDATAAEWEALLLGRLLRGMVAAGAPVWDADARCTRPVRYGDMALLLRSARGPAPLFAAGLTRSGVPVHSRLGSGYFAAVEVEAMLALLQVIDNPLQDIPLAAVLRSPVVGLTPADLARIRLSAPSADFFHAAQTAAHAAALEPDAAERLRSFLADLDGWRTAARRGRLGDLIAHIHRQTGLLAHAAAMPGGRQREANLRALADRARQFDRFARQGLFRFLRFVEQLRASGDDLAPPAAYDEAEDAVRILTIHRSKGLEFPVVAVANLGSAFRRPEGDVLLDRELGLGPRLVDLERRASHPSLAHHAVQERLRLAGLGEELRLLYVAMTRARERLLLVGSVRDAALAGRRWTAAAGFDGRTLPEAVIAEARSCLDWLGPALARHPDGLPLRALTAATPGAAEPVAPPAAGEAETAGAGGAAGPAAARARGDGSSPNRGGAVPEPSRWQVRVWTRNELAVEAARPPDATVAGRPAPEAPAPEAKPVADEPSAPRVSEPAVLARLRWRYPHASLADRFAKRSVTELRARPDPDGEEAPPPAALRGAGLREPRFRRPLSTGPTASERGTAVHVFLQHVDLGTDLDQARDVARQVEALVARDVMSPEEAACVDPATLTRFFVSPLGIRLRAAHPRVWREWMFTLGLRAARVYPDLPEGIDAGETIVIQGVIDCLAEEAAGLLLVDFKTDRIEPGARDPAAVLLARYGGQLSLYREAAEAITGRSVAEACLCALGPGLVVAVPAGLWEGRQPPRAR